MISIIHELDYAQFSRLKRCETTHSRLGASNELVTFLIKGALIFFGINAAACARKAHLDLFVCADQAVHHQCIFGAFSA